MPVAIARAVRAGGQGAPAFARGAGAGSDGSRSEPSAGAEKMPVVVARAPGGPVAPSIGSRPPPALPVARAARPEAARPPLPSSAAPTGGAPRAPPPGVSAPPSGSGDLLLRSPVREPAPARGGAPRVQRTTEASPPATQGEGEPAPAAEASAPEPPDLDEIAERVTRMIVRQLDVERERRGASRWP